MEGPSTQREEHRQSDDGVCVGEPLSLLSAVNTGSATISTLAQGFTHVQTNFKIATNLNIHLGGMADVKFAHTRFAC